ncbi:MAG TPA: hypothetical protein VID95_04360 [Candidatus Limnocylindrales bacterium]|jgi:hypothetical protein
MPSSSRRAVDWWADKTRQALAHARARVDPAEREQLVSWLRPSELALFDAMHVADRRHGLDVVAHLRAGGVTERDVLVAGLLHDCAKGDTGLAPRVAYSLGTRYGTWIWRVAGLVPGWPAVIERLRVHADASAELARGAGCSDRTIDLIRHQEQPVDPDAGERLRLADEAS